MTAKRSAIAAVGRTCGGFTLAELLVSVFVLAIIIFMVAQLMTSATAVTRTGHKHIDTDTQARVVLDRIALDFAQMLKRTDVDYYVKGPANYQGHGNGHGWGRGTGTDQQANDQIAFFTQVPGYYPADTYKSPLSLVAYRVNQNTNTGNSAFLKLERMGKGLRWNGVDTQTNQNATYPIVFLPQTIAGIGRPWSAAINNSSSCGGGSNNSCDPDYEMIGPGVFRFEYYYLLKNGQVTDVPWNRDVWGSTRTSLTNPTNIGLSEIESIAVAIAVIDPAGRALINGASSSSLFDLASDMDDFKTAPGRGVGGTKKIGDMEYQWKAVLVGDASMGIPGVINTGQTSAGSPVPPEAAKAIRIYNRYFDLKSL
jgi:hypothetical protein